MRVSRSLRNPWFILALASATGLLVPALALTTLIPRAVATDTSAHLELAGQATLITALELPSHDTALLEQASLETATLAYERVGEVLGRIAELARSTGRDDLERDSGLLIKRIRRLQTRLEDATLHACTHERLRDQHRLRMQLLIGALRRHALGSLYGEFLGLRDAVAALGPNSTSAERQVVEQLHQKFRKNVQMSSLGKNRREAVLADLDSHRRAHLHGHPPVSAEQHASLGEARRVLGNHLRALIRSEHVDGLGDLLIDLVQVSTRFEHTADAESQHELDGMVRRVQQRIHASLLPEARKQEIEQLQLGTREARDELAAARSRMALGRQELQFLLETIRTESEELRSGVRSHVHGSRTVASKAADSPLGTDLVRQLLWAALLINLALAVWVAVQLWQRDRQETHELVAPVVSAAELLPDPDPDRMRTQVAETEDGFVVLEDS